MGNIEKELTKFNLRLGAEWQKLHTAKWRRPKWIKFPRSMLDDARWLRLSPQAAKSWMHMLVIASESENLKLPAPDILFIRLRSIGDVQKRTTFVALIYELIQCGFLLKTTPELQSYRVSELQSFRASNKKDKRESASEASNGFASPASEEKKLGEDGRGGSHYDPGQPKQPIPIPKVDWSAPLGSFRPVRKTAPANHRCPAFLTVTDHLAGLAPELAAEIG